MATRATWRWNASILVLMLNFQAIGKSIWCNNMALKDKWKETGKNTGKAFGNFGKALGKSMKVAFNDEPNCVEENGHTETGNAWRETGKAFGEAGKSLGQAVEGTVDKATGEEKEDK